MGVSKAVQSFTHTAWALWLLMEWMELGIWAPNEFDSLPVDKRIQQPLALAAFCLGCFSFWCLQSLAHSKER